MKSFLIPLLIVVLAVAVMIAWFGPKEALRAMVAPLVAPFEALFVLQMKPSPKAVLVIAAVSKTNGATASASFDTLGYDHATIDIQIPTADTTTDGVSVLKLSESDDTTTTVTDIPAFTGGTQTSTSVGFVLPVGKTSGMTTVKMNVDLKKRKRYLTLTIVPRTTQIVSAVANMQLAEQEPTNAADAGVDTLVNG